MALQILVFSRYSDQGASSRFRLFQYVQFWRSQPDIALTVRTENQSLFDNAYVSALYAGESRRTLILLSYWRRLVFILSRPKADVLWIEKELFPWIPAFVERGLLRFLGIPYVLDYDDAVFHNYDLNSRPWVRRWLGDKHPRLMRHATAVIAGNRYLADKARESKAAHVFEIPTVVSDKIYEARPTEEVASAETKTIVGWIGSPSTVKYLELIHPVLQKISLTHSFEFHVVGARCIWSDVPVRNIPWSEATEVRSIQNFDIGLMPLFNSAWEKGKCGFKLIQYMACEKPVIASRIGCNADIVVEQQTGLLASDESEWLQSMTELLENSHKRHQLGAAGRLRFEKNYSLEQMSPKVLKILLLAASKKWN